MWQEEVARLGPWFHNIHLPDGTQTAPHWDNPARLWEMIQFLMPALDGRTVLDIGCNSGYISLVCAQFGAKVTTMDRSCRCMRQIELVRRAFGVEMELVQGDIEDPPAALKGRKWDIVLFMGVFYHLENPLRGMFNLLPMIGDFCVFETDMRLAPASVAVFDPYDYKRYNALWLPTPSCMDRVFKYCGAEVMEFMPRVGSSRYIYKIRPTEGQPRSVDFDDVWKGKTFLSQEVPL